MLTYDDDDDVIFTNFSYLELFYGEKLLLVAGKILQYSFYEDFHVYIFTKIYAYTTIVK